MVIELFKPFPRVRLRSVSVPVLPPSVARDFPVLEADVRVVEEVLAEPFRVCDLRALGLQNEYRRRNVVVLVGSALLTGLGGLQAAFADRAWPGLVLGVLAAVVAGVSRAGKERDTAGQYLSLRLRAERLRALHFRFLARTGVFEVADDAVRRRALERAVIDVRSGQESW